MFEDYKLFKCCGSLCLLTRKKEKKKVVRCVDAVNAHYYVVQKKKKKSFMDLNTELFASFQLFDAD